MDTSNQVVYDQAGFVLVTHCPPLNFRHSK